MAHPPSALRRWSDGAWRHWYAAVWAETAVLAELADRHARVEQARFIVGNNPVASAMVERADALAVGDRDRLLEAAATFGAAGCPYQRARTPVFAGGAARIEGEAVLRAIGASVMVI